MEPEELYRRLGRIIAEMPEISANAPLDDAKHMWIARADALVMRHGEGADKGEWRVAVNNLGNVYQSGTSQRVMRLVLYRMLGAAELSSPASVQGAFIPVGASFDTFAALAKVFQEAKSDILIVDPYMDESALTEFGGTVPNGALLRLMADEASYKQSLEPAAKRWVTQYGSTRPLEVRLAPPRALHDRAIFIDKSAAWTLTQSLKDFAKRSPAEIVRADDTASLKIAAYEAIWATAKAVV